jgi:hypothetical protein
VHTPVILALGAGRRIRFEVSLGYVVSSGQIGMQNETLSQNKTITTTETELHFL